MYSTYWVVVTWQRDSGGTWYVWWGILILVTMLLTLWTLPLAKVKIKHFWFAMWPHNWSLTWLYGWSSLILSHHPAKFGVHTPYESGKWKCFLLVKWPWCWSVMWFCGWGPFILILHPAKFGVHRPCENGNITFFICHL